MLLTHLIRLCGTKSRDNPRTISSMPTSFTYDLSAPIGLPTIGRRNNAHTFVGALAKVLNVLGIRIGALVGTVLEDEGDLRVWVCQPLCSCL